MKIKNLKAVYIVPYSHMDWSWRAPRTYFEREANRVIFSMLDCLENFKDYRWEGIHEAVEIRDPSEDQEANS